MDNETIVVGGGMAGMSCALKLAEAGRDVLLVTDELGGRVCYKPEYDSNFGAVFFMENYTNARKILTDKGPMEVKLGDLMLHTSKTKVFKGNSATMVKSFPQMIKFQHFMKHEFMPEYDVYKKECETMPVDIVMERHPKIKRYFYMKADQLIKELGIGKIADNFVSKFAYACTGSKINQLNALDFLNTVQGTVIPIHDFKFEADKFTAKLGGKVLIDKAVAIERADNACWQVTLESGKVLTSKYMVAATTGLTNQRLLHIDKVRQPTRLLSYLVEGKARPEIAKAAAHYFGDTFDIIAINARSDGRFNVFSRTDIDLDEYFYDPKVIYYRDWPESLFTYGDIVQKQDWAENLWIAGDINGLGMEPAAISGIYAANRILGLA